MILRLASVGEVGVSASLSARAAEMTFTGERIDADTAADWGLVSRVVAHDELLTPRANRALQVIRATVEPGGHSGERGYATPSEAQFVHVANPL